MMSEKFYSMLLGGTLAMMIGILLSMSDMVIAGLILGPDAVAGLTLVMPLASLTAFFASICSVGVPQIYSREMGKFNKQKADQACGCGLLISIVVGVLMFLLTAIFGDLYLQSNAVPETILNGARNYLFWIRINMLINPVVALMSSMVYSDGDSTLCSIASAAGGIGNFGGSLILSCIMGVGGIGLATLLFTGIYFLIILTHFLKKNNSIRLNLYYSWDLLKKMVRYGIADASSFLFLAILCISLNAFVSIRFGAENLLLVSVGTLCGQLQMVCMGIGRALTPILNVYLGEESRSGIQYIYRLAHKTAIAEGIVVTLALLLSAPLLPGMLGITDPELLRHAVALQAAASWRWAPSSSAFCIY